MKKITLDPNTRWEKGMPHHPKSEELFRHIAKIDFDLAGDYFCWKSGGDGDNGETLMYEMDSYFEMFEDVTGGRTTKKEPEDIFPKEVKRTK